MNESSEPAITVLEMKFPIYSFSQNSGFLISHFFFIYRSAFFHSLDTYCNCLNGT